MPAKPVDEHGVGMEQRGKRLHVMVVPRVLERERSVFRLVHGFPMYCRRAGMTAVLPPSGRCRAFEKRLSFRDALLESFPIRGYRRVRSEFDQAFPGKDEARAGLVLLFPRRQSSRATPLSRRTGFHERRLAAADEAAPRRHLDGGGQGPAQGHGALGVLGQSLPVHLGHPRTMLLLPFLAWYLDTRRKQRTR